MTIQQLIDGLKKYDPDLPVEVSCKNEYGTYFCIPVGFNVYFDMPESKYPSLVIIQCNDCS